MAAIQEDRKRIVKDFQASILRSVLYFDVFHYPLTEEELYENSGLKASQSEFKQALRQLEEQGLIKRQGQFILCSHAGDQEIARRLKGNAGAASMMDTAIKYSQRIARFPFVRGVFLSGALSKNYYDEKGDVDYFIVTEPGRLWICRTLLILRYKLLPANKRKFWCVNYFVSADNLEIADKNAFTATELAYLIPTFNYTLYQKMLHANHWFREQFPQKPLASPSLCLREKPSRRKGVIENLFLGWGNWADNFLLKLTLKNWQKKYPEMRAEDFELQFRSRKNVCKRHTFGFQNRVLKLWKEKQEAYELFHNVVLEP